MLFDGFHGISWFGEDAMLCCCVVSGFVVLLHVCLEETKYKTVEQCFVDMFV